ncbi:hypothetical protein [Nostoc sp. CCY 9925]|uniref:hypothetical protein n=1 Tax=Nostoc sp. CCY 9925 TaxID=3103865 RepID=UPI0039C63C02
MNTIKLTEKFESALVYATRLHANQTRKISGVPYISHLLSVAALVIEAGRAAASCQQAKSILNRTKINVINSCLLRKF